MARQILNAEFIIHFLRRFGIHSMICKARLAQPNTNTTNAICTRSLGASGRYTCVTLVFWSRWIIPFSTHPFPSMMRRGAQIMVSIPIPLPSDALFFFFILQVIIVDELNAQLAPKFQEWWLISTQPPPNEVPKSEICVDLADCEDKRKYPVGPPMCDPCLL